MYELLLVYVLTGLLLLAGDIGWSAWTVWSLCDVSNEQTRKRVCDDDDTEASTCQGAGLEKRMCIYNEGSCVRHKLTLLIVLCIQNTTVTWTSIMTCKQMLRSTHVHFVNMYMYSLDYLRC